MRIIHSFRIHPGDTGSERFMFELSTEMRNKGYNITILTSDLKKWNHFFNYHSKLELYKDGIYIRRIPSTFLRFINPYVFYRSNSKLLRFFDYIYCSIEYGIVQILKKLNYLRKNAIYWSLFQDILGWKMFLFLKKEKCDLIHTTCIPRSIITASLLYAKRYNIPIMISPFYHYSEESFYKYDNFWMKILNKFDCINVSTNAEANYLIKHGVNKEKIVKLGVGIHYHKSQKENTNWRRRLKISEDKFVVLYMNTQIYDTHKGILEVIGAALQLPSVEFIFTGKNKNSWKKMIDNHFKNKKLDNCHYVGFISEEKKASLIKSVDIIARPSKNEAFGIIYFEGMNQGKPVITSNIEPMKELFSDVGINVKYGDVDDLIRAIQKLQSDKKVYENFSKNGLKKSQHFSWEFLSDKFDNIYKNLVMKNKVYKENK